MNTKALRCFIEVYEKKSVAAAAREIFISPQGLSKIIKQLEYDLETELFFRGSQGMEATEAGELLYARARHICYLLDDIKKEISILGGSKGALHVALTYSAAAALTLDTLYQFSEVNSNVQLNISEYPDEYPIHDLFQDEADVGIVLGHEGISNCSYELLIPGRTVLTVGQEHELAGRSMMSVSELDGSDLVIKSSVPGQENQLVAACKRADSKPRVAFSSGNIAAMRRSCLKSNLIVESNDVLERAYPDDDVHIIQLKERINQNIYFISRDREIQNRAVTQFRDYIKARLKENPLP